MAMQWPSSGGGYNDLRSKMEGCGGAEKFWSFGSKLPYVPPYAPGLFLDRSLKAAESR